MAFSLGSAWSTLFKIPTHKAVVSIHPKIKKKKIITGWVVLFAPRKIKSDWSFMSCLLKCFWLYREYLIILGKKYTLHLFLLTLMREGKVIILSWNFPFAELASELKKY